MLKLLAHVGHPLVILALDSSGDLLEGLVHVVAILGARLRVREPQPLRRSLVHSRPWLVPRPVILGWLPRRPPCSQAARDWPLRLRCPRQRLLKGNAMNCESLWMRMVIQWVWLHVCH